MTPNPQPTALMAFSPSSGAITLGDLLVIPFPHLNSFVLVDDATTARKGEESHLARADRWRKGSDNSSSLVPSSFLLSSPSFRFSFESFFFPFEKFICSAHICHLPLLPRGHFLDGSGEGGGGYCFRVRWKKKKRKKKTRLDEGRGRRRWITEE